MHVQRLRPFAREVQGRVPPAQRVRGGMRRRGDEHRQHEALGVPERVPVVARPGEPLGRDRALLGPARRLQRVEQPEPHGLLHGGIAVDLDVGAGPEVVQRGALVGDQLIPTGACDGGQCGVDLVAQRGQRAKARPAVRDEFRHLQPLARLQHGAGHHPGPVRLHFQRRADIVRCGKDVLHRGGHP